MDFIIDMLAKTDVGVIIAVFFSLYLLSEKIDKKLEKFEFKMDKMDDKLLDIDRRLCRLEGAFASKDCCMIKDNNKQKMAE